MRRRYPQIILCCLPLVATTSFAQPKAKRATSPKATRAKKAKPWRVPKTAKFTVPTDLNDKKTWTSSTFKLTDDVQVNLYTKDDPVKFVCTEDPDEETFYVKTPAYFLRWSIKGQTTQHLLLDHAIEKDQESWFATIEWLTWKNAPKVNPPKVFRVIVESSQGEDHYTGTQYHFLFQLLPKQKRIIKLWEGPGAHGNHDPDCDTGETATVHLRKNKRSLIMRYHPYARRGHNKQSKVKCTKPSKSKSFIIRLRKT